MHLRFGLALVWVLLLLLPKSPVSASSKRAALVKDRHASLPLSQLLADNQGRIDHLLLHFADYDIIPTLYGLLHSLPVDTKITIASPKGPRSRVLRSLLHHWPIKKPQRIAVLPLSQTIDFWIRDDFVVAAEDKLVLPSRYGPTQLPASMKRLQQQVKIHGVHSSLRFDGGNVVTSEDHVFIGYNVILENLGENFSDPEALLQYIKHLFGKSVVVVGGPAAPLPHEHIDMFLTPLSGNRLLLGDPRLATHVLKKHKSLLRKTYSKVYFNEEHTPLPEASKALLFNTPDFVSRLQQDHKIEREDEVERDEDVTLAALYAKNALVSTGKLFDGIAADLRRKGFKNIVRVPILVNTGIDNGPFITYNNMLLESKGGRDIAYMPSYNIDVLDKAAQKILSAAGYKVVPIDVQNIAFYNGTLRCITQVLARKG